MSRTARFLKNEICYHVMTHAHHGCEIFSSEADYRYYCRLLKRYKVRFAIHIFAFCLMSRDVHLVVQPTEAKNLSLFMQRVNQAYALYFNKKYQKQGPLWRGRFKSVMIDHDFDLFECIKYVEFYPVRSAITHSPVEYPWSSCSLRILGNTGNLIDAKINRDDVWLISSSLRQPQKKKHTQGQTIPI